MSPALPQHTVYFFRSSCCAYRDHGSRRSAVLLPSVDQCSLASRGKRHERVVVYEWRSCNFVSAGGGSASTCPAPRNEAPFLSPPRPPLRSIQKRAEQIAPLHEPPPIDNECYSEEEVAQYMKPRPKKNGRVASACASPARSLAPTSLPRQKLLSDSAIITIESILMQLPRSRLDGCQSI